MTHTCHAINCTNTVPPKLLMCRSHWRKVPKALQKAIWSTYVTGQEARKDPTALYLMVQNVTVGVVAVTEGVWSEDNFRDHIKQGWDRWHGLLTDEQQAYFRHLMESWKP